MRNRSIICDIFFLFRKVRIQKLGGKEKFTEKIAECV
jgi:hypothetical protein